VIDEYAVYRVEMGNAHKDSVISAIDEIRADLAKEK
jgi:hypothetical protein